MAKAITTKKMVSILTEKYHCNLWEKNGNARVYLSNEFMGLDYKWKTRPVSTAYLYDEYGILDWAESNNKRNKWLATWDLANAYIDLETGDICKQNYHTGMNVMNAIESRIETVIAEEDITDDDEPYLQIKDRGENTENALPALEGSEKQIAWAEKIRKYLIEKAEAEIETKEEVYDQSMEEYNSIDWNTWSGLPKETIDSNFENMKNQIENWKQGLQHAQTITSASWWIDHRDNSGSGILDAGYEAWKESRPEAIAAKAEAKAKAEEEEARKQAEWEATHQPYPIEYGTYKDHYGKHKIVPDSYNSADKTIMVRMTEEEHQQYLNEYAPCPTEMTYKQYKDQYRSRVAWNYNEHTGMITVKLTAAEARAFQPEDPGKHYSERCQFRAGLVDELTIVPDTINADEITVDIPAELVNA